MTEHHHQIHFRLIFYHGLRTVIGNLSLPRLQIIQKHRFLICGIQDCYSHLRLLAVFALQLFYLKGKLLHNWLLFFFPLFLYLHMVQSLRLVHMKEIFIFTSITVPCAVIILHDSKLSRFVFTLYPFSSSNP